MNKKRVIALATAVAVLFVMLFSAVYIVKNSRHECCGENCQICYNISVCGDTMKTLSKAVCAVCVALAAIYALCRAVECSVDIIKSATLISQKVELLN